ncbi:MAG TPA: SusC/RagA family TonB-linked outer membrane protein [Niastella sp.]
MKKNLKMVVPALLLVYTHAVAQGPQPKIPRSYYQDSVRKVLLDILKYTGYGNVIDNALLRRTKTFTCNRDSLTLPELIKELNKQVQLDFSISDADKWISAEPKGIRGKVVDEKGMPAPGVTVQVDTISVRTDENGKYYIPRAIFGSVLVLTAVSRHRVTIKINQRQDMPDLVMRVKASDLDNVNVVVSNGYVSVPKDRLTGSFNFLNRKQIDRTISSSILPTMQGKVPGFVFLENRQSGSSQPFALIRGISTIFSNASPLIIVDNFPFPGNINDLNPNDVESITFLKDAAAASIWGARTANGVIVITTKKGAYNKQLQVECNTSFTFSARPDQWNMPQLGPEDFLEVEKSLYDSGYYNVALFTDYALVSPVIEILHQYDSNKISMQERTDRLKALASYDIRNDINDRFYRPGFIERYHVSVRKGSSKLGYYGSMGYDREKAAQVWTSFDRITTNNNLFYKGRSFELNGTLTGIFSRSINDQPLPQIPYLIGRLADSAGRPVAVAADVRQLYKDQMSNILPDWDYRPLDELHKNKLTQKKSFMGGSLLARDTVFKYFTVSLMYQFFKITEKLENDQSPDSYAARDLRNKTAEINNGVANFTIPKGGIYTRQEMCRQIENSRLQINYDRGDSGFIRIAALAGIESSKTTADTFSLQVYGWEKDRGNFPQLNYADAYPFFYNSSLTALIPYYIDKNRAFDYYTSIFGNAGFTYRDRYSFSVSGRIDESNLFGVKAKQKRIPLASAGVKWEILKDSLFTMNWLSYVNLRFTAGTNGNVNTSVSAYTIAERAPENRYGVPTVGIINPANDYLRWEKSSMFNIGLDWADKGRHFTCSFEYYWRRSDYLLAPSFQESTYGNRVLWDNVAALSGKGFDLSLNTFHTIRDIKVRNGLFFSQATNKVTRYEQTLIRANQFTDQRFVTPRVGFPVYNLYAFKWGGLDPANGDPRGYLNGELSKNYTAIVNGSTDNLVNIGSTVPVFFGGLNSVITYKQLELSATFTGRFKYYFRRSAISYADPLRVKLMGQYDYSKRWQRTGDEENTTVPSLKVWTEENRDFFYANSEATVEKADQIRLQEVKISYNIRKWLPENYPVRSCFVYIYASNIGIIWKANKSGIDPDFLYRFPIPGSCTIGARFEL